MILALIGTTLAYDLSPDKKKITYENSTLHRVYDEAVVDATPQEVWAALADFGNAEHIAASIYESDTIGDVQEMGVGCERYCNLEFQGNQVHVKERVFEVEDGHYYTYDVYEFVNFPAKQFHATFGVKTNEAGQTVVFNLVDYKLKYGMTPLMRGTMQESARTTVLGYKHFVETGNGNLALDELEALYPNA